MLTAAENTAKKKDSSSFSPTTKILHSGYSKVLKLFGIRVFSGLSFSHYMFSISGLETITTSSSSAVFVPFLRLTSPQRMRNAEEEKNKVFALLAKNKAS